MIVVLGVFLGLQVNNWNEARLERHNETFALERLLEEAENAVAYIEEVVELRDRENRAREEAIAFIVDPESARVDEADAAAALASFGYYPPMMPIRAAYDELIASGRWRLVRSRRVRDAAAVYVSVLEDQADQLEYFRLSSGADIQDKMAAFLRAEFDPDPGNPDRRILSADWGALRADERARYELLDAHRNQLTFNGFRRGVLEHAQALCDAVAAELDRACRPRKANPSSSAASPPPSAGRTGSLSLSR